MLIAQRIRQSISFSDIVAEGHQRSQVESIYIPLVILIVLREHGDKGITSLSVMVFHVRIIEVRNLRTRAYLRVS